MDMEKLRQGLRKLTENRNSIKLLAVIMIIITAFLFYGMKEKNDTITVSEGFPAAKEDAGERKSSSEGILYVDVGGAVARPGVYKMNTGDRVFEAIEKAGGLTKKADTSALNQAEEVKDGQKIQIPEKGETAGAPGTDTAENSLSASVSAPGEKININTADSTALQQISGVGPATAQKIIDYRTQNGPFKRIEDLKNVSGIGEKTFEKMKENITI